MALRARFPNPVSGLTLSIGAFVLATGVIVGAAKSPFFHWRESGSPTAQTNVFPGFTVVPAAPPDVGLMVTSLQSNSPAELSGIEVGDLVEGLDSQPVGSVAEASNYLRRDPNAVVRIRVLHDYNTRDVTLRLNGTTVHGA